MDQEELSENIDDADDDDQVDFHNKDSLVDDPDQVIEAVYSFMCGVHVFYMHVLNEFLNQCHVLGI